MKFKKSKQRDAVFRILSQKNFHPTVDDLYDIVRKEFEHISLATVYRNVEQLLQMGLITKLDTGDGKARYDGNTQKHFHIICKECRKIQDVWVDFIIEDIVDINSVFPGFSYESYKINFLGICGDCRVKKSE